MLSLASRVSSLFVLRAALKVNNEQENNTQVKHKSRLLKCSVYLNVYFISLNISIREAGIDIFILTFINTTISAMQTESAV